MREIKFRAWHKQEKKMYWVDRIDWSRDASSIFYLGVQLPTTMRESSSKEYELMQYTGLKDKNGVEIYEGDILKSKYAHGQVVFETGCFGLDDLPNDEPEGFTSFEHILETDFEVIGNIYENKDLLK